MTELSLAERVDKLEKDLQTVRHFVCCHCDQCGYYVPDICGRCELVRFCWPSRDYGKDFPEGT